MYQEFAVGFLLTEEENEKKSKKGKSFQVGTGIKER